MNHPNWFYILYLTVIQFTIYAVCEELSVSPIAQALRVDESGIFECSFENSSYNSNLKWILFDGTVLLNGNTSQDGRFINEDGILKMTNLTIPDSGEYNCVNVEVNTTVTAHLKVYIMPSYLLEGSIVLAINGVLFILFIYSMIKTYREQNIKDRMHAF
ncbi:unnamed protein product [Schistosoma margrebowiei]|uniref:Ig-like domain-containing protein n=1 Tax=Schistosoma margrebowiei TaxID=48269 RepID=A0A183LWI2_9TREM|nr:unnamed protein product [Schistosoma margrebowiei]VDO79963.1 unnamed protein product [Schistosoma margrebowiei]